MTTSFFTHSSSFRIGACLLTLLGAMFLLDLGQARADNAVLYETPAAASQPDYQGVLGKLIGRHVGRVLVSDERLERVALWMATEAAQGPTDRGAVREILWREGIVDFEFSPILLKAPKGSSNTAQAALKTAKAALVEILDDPSIPWARYNTLAIASASRQGTVAIGLILVRRVVRIRGGFQAASSNGEMKITLSAEYQDPSLFITAPEGSVLQRKARRFSDRMWTVDSTAVGGAGSSLWELVATGPRGPEVLALWRQTASDEGSARLPVRRSPSASGGSAPLAHNPYLGTQQSPTQLQRNGTQGGREAAHRADSDVAAWVVGARAGPDRPPQPSDVVIAEDLLWSLIQETRRSRGLVALRRVPALTRAARQHASDLRRGEGFGHETSSGNALTRIEAQGVTALRATENVAMAANVVEAHAALMASPSHRANILDSEVSEGAVGVVLRRDSRGRWSAVASELFARLLAQGPGDQWHAAILNRINDHRKALGESPLTARDKLDELAMRTSQGILQSRTLHLSRDARKQVAAEARFHFLNVRRVGVDLMVTADPDRVDEVAHALQPSFREIGIGITRLKDTMGDHAPGTLVITLIFIER